MKNIFTLLLACSSFYVSNAQQTITGTSPIGYSATIAIASAATASNVPLTTGANVTWNCSALATSNPNVTLTINSPTGKPFAGDYPSSNYHMGVDVSGTILANEFYIMNSDSLVKLGGHVTGQAYEIYNNAQLDMKFPFSFNDVITDNYAKTSYNSNGSVSSTQTGSVTLSYEGYGTLILPAGTFSNVAMLKRVRTNSIGPTTTSYSWVKFPSGEKLMDYETNGGIKVNYLSSISTGIFDHQKEQSFTVYPTITEGKIFIKGPAEIGSVKVYNQIGQVIPATLENNSITLSGAKGIYFLQICVKEGTAKSLHKIILN